MTYREMIEAMVFAVSLLKQENQGDNEITASLEETIYFLENILWQDALAIEDEEEDERK